MDTVKEIDSELSKLLKQINKIAKLSAPVGPVTAAKRAFKVSNLLVKYGNLQNEKLMLVLQPKSGGRICKNEFKGFLREPENEQAITPQIDFDTPSEYVHKFEFKDGQFFDLGIHKNSQSS